MKVVITGGSGFIGSNLCKRLEASNFEELLVIDSLINSSKDNLTSCRGDFQQIDIIEREKLLDITSGFTHIVHLAALGSVPRSIENPHATFTSNVVGTESILEVARLHNMAVIFSSSSSIFGDSDGSPRNEHADKKPKSPYAHSKLIGEQLIESYRKTFNIRADILRFFNVFGPRQNIDSEYAAVIPRIVMSSITNSPFALHGDGSQVRDFTYVGDVCEVIYNLLTGQLQTDLTLNVAWGKPTSLIKVIRIIEKISNTTLNIEKVDFRNGDIMKSFNDPSALNNLLPRVKPTPLDIALQLTYEWYLTR